MPPLPNLAPPALVIDKPVYSVFAAHDELMRRRSDTLILTGAETDVCVLSTALGAIDHGYRVIIAEDAVCQLLRSGARFFARSIRATLQSANRGRRYANDSDCLGIRVNATWLHFLSANLRRKRYLYASLLSFAHLPNAAP